MSIVKPLVMFIYLKFTLDRRGWPVGLVAWFSLRVREVPGSTPGQAPIFGHIFFVFFFCFVCLFICFAFCFRLASNAFPDIESVGRIEKNLKKITTRTTLKIHHILLKNVPVFLYSVTMLIFQIKRIISGERWFNRVATFFFFFFFFFFFLTTLRPSSFSSPFSPTDSFSKKKEKKETT